MTGKIWAVCSKKGGPGKSTTAANLAVELQNKGFSVSVIDTDKQRTLSKFFDRRNELEDIQPIVCEEKQGKINLVADRAAQTVDYVIIDTPGRESPELVYTLAVANLIIIPSRTSYIDLEELDGIENDLELTEANAKPNRKAITFLNACTPRKIKAKRQAKELVTEYSTIPLAKQQIPNSDQFGFTMQHGRVISEQKEERAIAGSFQILTNELLDFEKQG